MLHVGVYDVEPELVNHGEHLGDADIVRCNLGLEVGQVLIDVSTRILPGEQQLPGGLFSQHTVFNHEEIIDQHPFLVDRGAVRRRRPWGATSDVGMVATRGDIEQNLVPRLVEHGVDHRDVGQVGAAVVRRIDGEGVSWLHHPVIFTHDRLDRSAHRPQVHRYMGSVGHQAAVRAKNRA